MPTLATTADATTLFATVQAAIESLPYSPVIPVKESKRRTVGNKARKAGWTAGYPPICFVLSMSGPERIDAISTFEVMGERYSMAVEYVKPQEQAVGIGQTGPSAVIEDEDTRNKRDDLINTLYVPNGQGVLIQPFANMKNLFQIQVLPGNVYDEGEEGKLVVTLVTFNFDTWKPRPGI